MKKYKNTKSENESMVKKSEESEFSKTGFNEIGNSSKTVAKQGTRNR